MRILGLILASTGPLAWQYQRENAREGLRIDAAPGRRIIRLERAGTRPAGIIWNLMGDLFWNAGGTSAESVQHHCPALQPSLDPTKRRLDGCSPSERERQGVRRMLARDQNNMLFWSPPIKRNFPQG